MYKVKIKSELLKDIHRIGMFVNALSKYPEQIILTDGNNYAVNGKSVVGCIAALEWDNLFIESEADVRESIKEFGIW